MGKHYPKDLNIPKEVVLRRRAQRKLNRQATGITSLRSKMGNLKKSGEKYSWEVSFRLYGKQQVYKDKRVSFHISGNDGYDTFLIKAKEPTREYLDWFWRMLQTRIIPMEWALKIFPNSKEQTESVTALFGVKDILDLKETTVIVVADGSTPRCGGLFAFFAKEVISIDPMMRSEFVIDQIIPNLECVTNTIEEWIKEKPVIDSSVAIIALHAHVAFQVYLESLLECINPDVPLAILSVACCQDLFITDEEKTKFSLVSLKEYDDWGMHSPHRTVRRWTRNLHSS
jgi:hypothetical protein